MNRKSAVSLLEIVEKIIDLVYQPISNHHPIDDESWNFALQSIKKKTALLFDKGEVPPALGYVHQAISELKKVSTSDLSSALENGLLGGRGQSHEAQVSDAIATKIAEGYGDKTFTPPKRRYNENSEMYELADELVSLITPGEDHDAGPIPLLVGTDGKFEAMAAIDLIDKYVVSAIAFSNYLKQGRWEPSEDVNGPVPLQKSAAVQFGQATRTLLYVFDQDKKSPVTAFLGVGEN